MIAPARSSHRIAHFLVSGLLAAVSGAVALVIAATVTATSASAAACQGCVIVSAPTINLNATAQPGLQAVIDQQGGVAVYTPLTTGTVGGPGTVWLVGHRTTHGSVFNQVPFLVAGDPIVLIDDAGAHQYIVSRLLIVSESDWESQVDIDDTSRSTLILQTSHPDSQLRYLIEAFGTGLVVPSSAEAVVPEVTIATPIATTATPIATTATPIATTAPVPSPAPEPPRTSKFGSIKTDV